jgi:copper(I)-binding protein
MRIINWYSIHAVAIAVLIAVVLISAANAAELTVSDAWIRALPSSIPSGGYFNLHNGGKTSVTLTGVSSPACGMLMLHRTENMGGVSQMSDIAGVNVPAGETIKFSPGGYHLMCMNATGAIKPGKMALVTLKFSDGETINAIFAVRNASGK